MAVLTWAFALTALALALALWFVRRRANKTLDGYRRRIDGLLGDRQKYHRNWISEQAANSELTGAVRAAVEAAAQAKTRYSELEIQSASEADAYQRQIISLQDTIDRGRDHELRQADRHILEMAQVDEWRLSLEDLVTLMLTKDRALPTWERRWLGVPLAPVVEWITERHPGAAEGETREAAEARVADLLDSYKAAP